MRYAQVKDGKIKNVIKLDKPELIPSFEVDGAAMIELSDSDNVSAGDLYDGESFTRVSRSNWRVESIIRQAKQKALTPEEKAAIQAALEE